MERVVNGEGSLADLITDAQSRTVHLRARAEDLARNLGALYTACAESARRARALGARESARRPRVSALAARIGTLTPRQREVLERVIAGQANKSIAFELKLSQKTVETHRARVMQKMQARSFAELVRLAIEAGLVA